MSLQEIQLKESNGYLKTVSIGRSLTWLDSETVESETQKRNLQVMQNRYPEGPFLLERIHRPHTGSPLVDVVNEKRQRIEGISSDFFTPHNGWPCWIKLSSLKV